MPNVSRTTIQHVRPWLRDVVAVLLHRAGVTLPRRVASDRLTIVTAVIFGFVTLTLSLRLQPETGPPELGDVVTVHQNQHTGHPHEVLRSG